MIITSDLVAIYEISIQIEKLHVCLSHIGPKLKKIINNSSFICRLSKGKLEINERFLDFQWERSTFAR